MLVDENTNSWIPVVDDRRGGATPQRQARQASNVSTGQLYIYPESATLR